MLHQREEVNQERRTELQKTGELTQEGNKGNFQDDGEGNLQNDNCEAGLEITKLKLELKDKRPQEGMFPRKKWNLTYLTI